MATATVQRRPSIPTVTAGNSPTPSQKVVMAQYTEQHAFDTTSGKRSRSNVLKPPQPQQRVVSNPENTREQGTHAIIHISKQKKAVSSENLESTTDTNAEAGLADELDYITVTTPPSDANSNTNNALSTLRPDKASRILGIRHRKSMEPIPASARNSIVSTRSLRETLPVTVASHLPTLPLTSLYVVSGLPKSPHTWTLADPDSVLGLHHSESAVNRWWRPEVLGSTVSPGAGGGKKSKTKKGEEIHKGAGALSKQEVGKMLSKALKLSFTREVEIIASTLQPASTVHTFSFTLPAPNTPLAPTPSGDLLRASVLSNGDNRSTAATFSYPYADDPFIRPSSAYLGPPSLLAHGAHSTPAGASGANASNQSTINTVTYHGVCLTVWSHADAERSTAIRRTLEAGRSRKESAQSAMTARLKNLRADISGSISDSQDPSSQARKQARRGSRGPWVDAETDAETDADGAISESDFEIASTVGHTPGESTLFLPGDTVFWLPYALTLVSRHPVYDLMRDYLTLSWARFSKDVQSHTLQISKILAHPAPRPGEVVRLDASPKHDGSDSNLEVIARFPGGLDFGRGLVDVNFTMWPLFKCLNIDNILTICEIALAPTGKVLFFSRYPAMLGIAVSTIKYLVELRGWNGIALPAVHSRDAKIYIDDPGPWIMGLATEARYSIRPASDVCVCDLDINYVSCPSPPPNVISSKQPRERYRQRLVSVFEGHYHPDYSVPSEFKEAFPAGRFRPVCKIQAKRGASSAAVADQIKPPSWWHSTRIIQAFDAVLADKYKKPSLLKRISMFGAPKRPPQLTAAEQTIQLSIRKRATAFVDARDDLETKIGRLSRRLNFLMTESDLWRDKFVTFEQYAEKLSGEAQQLRAKINKEQRESKRLSGLVSLTAAEKNKLQNQLRDTEGAHKDAMSELEKMRETMEKMEQERAEMVAEVEAQIERALASMAFGVEDSEYSSSRPHSRLSNASQGASGTRSRRASDSSRSRPFPSLNTESTLAEMDETGDMDETITNPISRETTTIAEDDETEVLPAKTKRFSASDLENPIDMAAVDEGISQKSDKIAQKVFEIQQKLENALAAERRASSERRVAKWKAHSTSEATEEELSEVGSTKSRPRSKRGAASIKARTRSSTTSSTQTNKTSTPTTATFPESMKKLENKNLERLEINGAQKSQLQGSSTPTKDSFLDVTQDDSTPEPSPSTLRTESTLVSERSPLNKGRVGPTSDSDTDFQSAYSTSPRGSYGSLEDDKANDFSESMPSEDRFSALPKTRRERVISATADKTNLPLSRPRIIT